ncbi:MAG: hypothetical protein ACC655_09555 [Rhodothermia bacterium]
MGTIQEDILEEFFEKLNESEEFDEDRMTRRRELFAAQKKPKAAALTEALSVDSKEEVP